MLEAHPTPYKGDQRQDQSPQPRDNNKCINEEISRTELARRIHMQEDW